LLILIDLFTLYHMRVATERSPTNASARCHAAGSMSAVTCHVCRYALRERYAPCCRLLFISDGFRARISRRYALSRLRYRCRLFDACLMLDKHRYAIFMLAMSAAAACFSLMPLSRYLPPSPRYASLHAAPAACR